MIRRIFRSELHDSTVIVFKWIIEHFVSYSRTFEGEMRLKFNVGHSFKSYNTLFFFSGKVSYSFIMSFKIYTFFIIMILYFLSKFGLT